MTTWLVLLGKITLDIILTRELKRSRVKLDEQWTRGDKFAIVVLVKGDGSLERVETKETVECGNIFEITKSKSLK